MSVDTAFLRIVRRLEEGAAAPPVVPACPSWCTLEPGHLDFERLEDGNYVRAHDADVGTSHLAWLSCDERSDGHGGPVSLTPPTITAESDFHCVEVTPAHLRAVAAECLAVADLYERITS